MFKALLQCAVITLSLLPTIGRSETIKLKLSFFSSDQSPNYLAAIKPFVEAVNREANGILEIQTFLSGSLGKNYPDTAQLVQSGVADLGFVNPGLTPDLFPDTAVIELPGLFRDTTEASLVYTRMVATGSLKDEYEKFFVVAAVGAGPQGIHVRGPITSLHDMKGLKIRSSNQTEGLVLAQLGMKPQVIPINRTTAALAEGAIDGVTATPPVFVEYGMSRIIRNHYFLSLGVTPLLILMNKQRFDGLSREGQDIIRKFSSEWLATRYAEIFDADTARVMALLKSDPRRLAVFPSPQDMSTAADAFNAVTEQWINRGPRNLDLIKQAKAEIGKLRSAR